MRVDGFANVRFTHSTMQHAVKLQNDAMTYETLD